MQERKSLMKQLANFKNAQKSTGPRTPQGKARVAQNPRKHGILSKEVIVKGGDGGERAAEFEELIQSLYAQSPPADAIERLLIDRVAACYWRLRRAQRYEVGAVREGLDSCKSPLQGLGPHQAKLFKTMENLESNRDAERETLKILNTPVEKLNELERMRRDTALHRAAKVVQRSARDLTDPVVMQEAVKACQHEIEAIQRELDKCMTVECHVADKYDALADSRRPLLAALPADEPLNRLIRYETMLDRQMHRALAELRRRHSSNPLQISEHADAKPADG